MTTSEPGGQERPDALPSAPALNEQELASVSPGVAPKAVQNAFLIWIVSSAIGVLGIIINLFNKSAFTDAARDALKRAGKSFSDQDVTNAANTAMVFSVVIGLIFVGLYVLFAYKMRAGRNWARITLTVLGGLGVVFVLLSLTGVGSGGSIALVLGLVQAVLAVVAIVFMFRPESNAFFNAGKARR